MGTAVLMRRSLDYCWRLIATAISFSAFGLGGLLLWTCVFPLVRLLAGRRRNDVDALDHPEVICRVSALHDCVGRHAPAGRRRREAAPLCWRAGSRQPSDTHRRRRAGLVDAGGGTLWSSRHCGAIHSSAAWFALHGYISNSDSDRLIGDCVDLHAGHPLLIFPEGTPPNATGAAARLSAWGGLHVALRGGRPILPVLIDCQPPTLTKRDHWYQIPPRRFCLRIRVLDETSVELLVEPSSVPAIAARQLTQARKVSLVGS